MKSMTGYGAADRQARAAEISVVVKSVNGRFLESRFHLPKEYFPFESQLKKLMNQSLHRGTVDVFIYRRSSNKLKIQLNKDTAKKWVDAHRALATATGLKFPTDSALDRLAGLPHVFDLGERSDRGAVGGGEEKDLLQTFKKALLACDKERIREGASLSSHMSKIISSLHQVIKKMQKLRESANIGIEVRLQERLKKLGFEGSVDPARISQEMVMYLDKIDIGEELQRLEEHVQMCQKLLKSKDSQGKKLDFYSQELLREVNTVGSKANYAPLTEQVVEAKALIEAFKEQVQNIE